MRRRWRNRHRKPGLPPAHPDPAQLAGAERCTPGVSPIRASTMTKAAKNLNWNGHTAEKRHKSPSLRRSTGAQMVNDAGNICRREY